MEEKILKVYAAMRIRPGQCLMHEFVYNTVKDNSEVGDEEEFLEQFRTTIRGLCDNEILRLANMTGLSYFLTEKGFQEIYSNS